MTASSSRVDCIIDLSHVDRAGRHGRASSPAVPTKMPDPSINFSATHDCVVIISGVWEEKNELIISMMAVKKKPNSSTLSMKFKLTRPPHQLMVKTVVISFSRVTRL